MTPAAATTSAASSTLTRVLLGLITTVFVVSVSARALIGSDDAASSPATPPAGSSAFLPGMTPTGDAKSAEETGMALESLLPVLTEASFFALVGFGLGYAGKKVAKLLLIFLALGFLLVQGLGYAEVVTVDWSKLVELLNTWILNVKEGQQVTEWLTSSLPTAGALIAGVVLGFRKG
ncbi:MAG: hypothetical protein DHS20C15_26200 [Planctomycetota bacterium]|nr:MAG: hypothetical protein DHS20C15_26200 [Planctomycetota bacterium]